MKMSFFDDGCVSKAILFLKVSYQRENLRHVRWKMFKDQSRSWLLEDQIHLQKLQVNDHEQLKPS